MGTAQIAFVLEFPSHMRMDLTTHRALFSFQVDQAIHYQQWGRETEVTLADNINSILALGKAHTQLSIRLENSDLIAEWVRNDAWTIGASKYHPGIAFPAQNQSIRGCFGPVPIFVRFATLPGTRTT